MTKIIEYFIRNHVVSNLVFGLVVAAGIYSWYDIRKEEYPDFTFDVISVSTSYPGASPREVEQAITLPLEHELADLEYLKRMESSSKRGSSRIRMELERGVKSVDLAVAEIQNRILAVDLPNEVENPPSVRYRKTSQKAVIDVALYFPDKPLLNLEDRRKLQRTMRMFENQLLRRNEVSLLERDAYLEEEIHVKPRREDLYRFRIHVKELQEAVLSHHTDLPLGIMETPAREQVRLEGRLEEPELFQPVPLRSSFTGSMIRLEDVADTVHAFQDTTTLVRINGYEAVVFNVVKSTSTGILEAVDVVKAELKDFLEDRKDAGVHAVVLDDESYGVRNRLSIISGNAIIGFALILVVLSLFLNPRAALWVSLGIPFSFFFTLILANLLDYTVNNMTLAGVIIAMGMLVDDAIVVSENISRWRSRGASVLEASIEGTREVIAPITASILTTFAAFLPLLAFEGRLALLTTTIPPIVGLILAGSLIESVIILPGHMTISLDKLKNLFRKKAPSAAGEPVTGSSFEGEKERGAFFLYVERWYIRHLQWLLHRRYLVFLFFAISVAGGIGLYLWKMNFSLFPREQLTTAFVIGEAPVHYDRYRTLEAIKPVETFLLPYVGKEFIGIRTTVGYRRYRPSEEEYVVSVRIEFDETVLNEEETDQIVEKIQQQLDTTKGFRKLRLSTQSFGSDTGSSLEILVQEDDNQQRDQLAEELATTMRDMPEIGYTEIDKPASEFEYEINPDRALMDRLNMDPSNVEFTLRSALSGVLLYRFYRENEEVDVRLRFDESVRKDINQVLQIPAPNNLGYQVPLETVVKAKRQESMSVINRVDQRRILKVNADIKEGLKLTPLEVAEKLEAEVFPELRKKYPSANFIFDGEVKNTRESTSFFQNAVIAVVILIFSILAIQFNSVIKPLIIMVAIIPAWVSLVYVFLLHGMSVYGFFAVVGALGLAGIVVNGSILLLDRLERDLVDTPNREDLFRQIAELSATRLRAVFLTTITTVAGLLPTAYGVAGYDSMLAEMMLAIAWGLVFAMSVTLVLVPVMASFEHQVKKVAD